MKNASARKILLIGVSLYLFVVLTTEVVFAYVVPPIFLNRTLSAPRGLYLLSKEFRLQRNELVIFSFPSNLKPYLTQYPWLKEVSQLKTIGALPGDTYCVVKGELVVEGDAVGKVYTKDNRERALPHLSGCSTVKPNNFLPLSVNKEGSFDGRNYGEVSQSLIMGKARPLFLF